MSDIKFGWFWVCAVCLSFVAVICGCGKREDASTSRSNEAETYGTSANRNESPSAKNPLPTIDEARLKHEIVPFEREEKFNVSMKDTRFEEALAKNWPVQKMMTTDRDGYQVLGGLRDDPNRYQLQGEVAGTVVREDTKAVITTYKFRVVKIMAGKTERLSDAYLVCKGTYWLPGPVPKADLPWDGIPATYATYEVLESAGVLLRAEDVISRSALKENRLETDKDLDSCFVLTGEFKPAILGKGSVHLRISPSTLAKEDIPKVVLAGPALDAVDLAIVMYAQQSAFNPIVLSSDTRNRLSKYGDDTTFNISMNGCFQTPEADGTRIIIGGEFVCKYDGVLKYTIKITEGEVGILKKGIYVKDGTRVQIDSDSYVFSEGKWRKAK